MNLAGYFQRIAAEFPAQSKPAPNLETLQLLIRRHTQTIAFENLNSLMRLPVPLDLDALEEKLVRRRRGGYCFEQNGLFAAVLGQIGFTVKQLSARVVWGQTDASSLRFPRTHMVLLVSLGDDGYLCDVGFGGITPTGALRIDTEASQATPHETFRFRHSDGLFTLQALVSDQWHDVYVFDLQAQSSVDYEMANHYVCTWPRSHFRHTLIAARALDGGRIHLRNRLLTTFSNDGQREKQELHGAHEFAAVLESQFGVVVPDFPTFERALATHIEGDDLTR